MPKFTCLAYKTPPRYEHLFSLPHHNHHCIFNSHLLLQAPNLSALSSSKSDSVSNFSYKVIGLSLLFSSLANRISKALPDLTASFFLEQKH